MGATKPNSTSRQPGLGVERLEDRFSVRAGVRVRLIIVAAAVVFPLSRALHPQD